MKVILPLAGLGTRLRPHTYTKPKPLVSVAGKPVLGHILRLLRGLDVDEVVFITGYLGDQIEKYVRDNYDFPARFVEQTELRGQAHALHLAADAIDQPVLIIFVDTIIQADLRKLAASTDDGVLFVKTVDDPRRFGVAVLKDGFIERLVEKPKEPVSNLAVVGFYYIRNWQLLRQSLQEVIDQDIKTGGEHYLADALQLMIQHGARLRAETVDVWEDCGTIDAILQTNRFLLAHGSARDGANLEHSVVIPPSYIAPTATITNSIVGPNATIGEGTIVTDSVVRDSIVGSGSKILSSLVDGSMIGDQAIIRGTFRRLNVGDSSETGDE